MKTNYQRNGANVTGSADEIHGEYVLDHCGWIVFAFTEQQCLLKQQLPPRPLPTSSPAGQPPASALMPSIVLAGTSAGAALGPAVAHPET